MSQETEDRIPFLLYDGNYIFHTDNVAIDERSYYQYCLMTYLYLLLSNEQILYKPFIENYVDNYVDNYVENFVENYVYNKTDLNISTNCYVINNINYSPLAIMKYLIEKATNNQLENRRFDRIIINNNYIDLLRFVIHYSSVLGILTTTDRTKSKIIEVVDREDIIDSIHWRVKEKNLESCRPIYHYQTIETIQSKNPCIITGMTGSGKTITMPKLFFLYYKIINSVDYFVDGNLSPDVIIGFPRRSLAKENMTNAYFPDLGYIKPGLKPDEIELGDYDYSPFVLEIGKHKNSKTETESDKFLEKIKNEYPSSPSFILGTSEKLYTILGQKPIGLVIIDEFHEHDLKSDILFSIAFKKKCQIVIITATPSDEDKALLPKFFPISTSIYIAGSKVFPIEEVIDGNKNMICLGRRSSSSVSNNYRAKIDKWLRKIISNIEKGNNILVFVPYIPDVTSLVDKYSKLFPKCKAIGFYGGVSIEAKSKIDQYGINDIVIIFATPAAESSVTFPRLSYVIDSGLDAKPFLVPNDDFSFYSTKAELRYINKFRYLQRKGRLGRTKPGTAILLYDPKTLDSLTPTVLNDNIISLILLMYRFSITKDELFVQFNTENNTLFNRAYRIINNVILKSIPLSMRSIKDNESSDQHCRRIAKEFIQSINIERLKGIFWPQSIYYYSLECVPESDKELYEQLWSNDSSSGKTQHQLYTSIKHKSFLPRKVIRYCYSQANAEYFAIENNRINKISSEIVAIRKTPLSIRKDRNTLYYLITNDYIVETHTIYQ